MRSATREPSIAATTGRAVIALVFVLLTSVFVSHSSHVKNMVEVSEKQKSIEDLLTGAPITLPSLSGLRPSSLKSLTMSSDSLISERF